MSDYSNAEDYTIIDYMERDYVGYSKGIYNFKFFCYDTNNNIKSFFVCHDNFFSDFDDLSILNYNDKYFKSTPLSLSSIYKKVPEDLYNEYQAYLTTNKKDETDILKERDNCFFVIGIDTTKINILTQYTFIIDDKKDLTSKFVSFKISGRDILESSFLDINFSHQIINETRIFPISRSWESIAGIFTFSILIIGALLFACCGYRENKYPRN